METRERRSQANENRRKAMSHPLRAEVLLILSERTASPVEMARQLGADVAAVSHHTKRLVALECAELTDERKVRGAVQHFYRATERHLIETSDWNELHPLVAEDLVGQFMQAKIDDFVASARAGMIGSDDRFHLTRTRLILDEEGMQEVLAVQEQARQEIMAAEDRARARLAESGESGFHVSSSLGCFEVPPA
jgi:predicted ArsR family transcriptional regulator